MRIVKAILIASFSIPVMVFMIFLVAGIVFLVSDVVESGEYDNGWLGIVFAGSVYAYFSFLLSTAPTIVLGLPICLLAKKYGFLTRKVILVGAAVTGGLFLVVAALVFFDTVNIELITWSFVVGGVGGLINGYVFQKVKKPDNRLQTDAATPNA